MARVEEEGIVSLSHRERTVVRVTLLLLFELAFGRWAGRDPTEVLDELRGTP